GTPAAQIAGTPFTVRVNAVDANWNVISTNDVVSFASSDSNAVLPSNAALLAGTQTFSVTLKTAGTRTITASDVTHVSIAANTSPAFTVNAGAFAKLQLLVPGETAAPGSATGKTGATNLQTPTIPFNVTVNAVDANWNLTSSVSDNVGITASDTTATLPANAALAAGTQTYTVAFNTNGSFTVTATDLSDGSKTPNTSPAITVGVPQFTQATGGSAISADGAAAPITFTSLTGPTYTENNPGEVGLGTIILNAPAGFIFDTNSPTPSAL